METMSSNEAGRRRRDMQREREGDSYSRNWYSLPHSGNFVEACVCTFLLPRLDVRFSRSSIPQLKPSAFRFLVCVLGI